MKKYLMRTDKGYIKEISSTSHTYLMAEALQLDYYEWSRHEDLKGERILYSPEKEYYYMLELDGPKGTILFKEKVVTESRTAWDWTEKLTDALKFVSYNDADYYNQRQVPNKARIVRKKRELSLPGSLGLFNPIAEAFEINLTLTNLDGTIESRADARQEDIDSQYPGVGVKAVPVRSLRCPDARSTQYTLQTASGFLQPLVENENPKFSYDSPIVHWENTKHDIEFTASLLGLSPHAYRIITVAEGQFDLAAEDFWVYQEKQVKDLAKSERYVRTKVRPGFYWVIGLEGSGYYLGGYKGFTASLDAAGKGEPQLFTSYKAARDYMIRQFPASRTGSGLYSVRRVSVLGRSILRGYYLQTEFGPLIGINPQVGAAIQAGGYEGEKAVRVATQFRQKGVRVYVGRGSKDHQVVLDLDRFSNPLRINKEQKINKENPMSVLDTDSPLKAVQPEMFIPGEYYLLNTHNWFTAPDGQQYNAIWGRCYLRKAKDMLGGIKNNSNSTNWYIVVGDENPYIVGGCQVMYAGYCPEKPPLLRKVEKEDTYQIRISPSYIYMPDEPRGEMWEAYERHLETKGQMEAVKEAAIDTDSFTSPGVLDALTEAPKEVEEFQLGHMRVRKSDGMPDNAFAVVNEHSGFAVFQENGAYYVEYAGGKEDERRMVIKALDANVAYAIHRGTGRVEDQVALMLKEKHFLPNGRYYINLTDKGVEEVREINKVEKMDGKRGSINLEPGSVMLVAKDKNGKMMTAQVLAPGQCYGIDVDQSGGFQAYETEE